MRRGDVVVTPWFYNKSIFEEAGLDPDHTPETFGEWMGMLEKIQAAGYIPIAWAGSGDDGDQSFEWLARVWLLPLPADHKRRPSLCNLG